jgi:hypothetical protein
MTPTEPRSAAGALRGGLAAAPALLLALLPKVACPACWPAYGSVLSGFGLGGLPASPWRVPMLVVLLAPALWLLARDCRRRHRRWPFVSGLGGAATSLAGALGDQVGLSLAGSVLFLVAMAAVTVVDRAAPPPGRCCRRAPASSAISRSRAVR